MYTIWVAMVITKYQLKSSVLRSYIKANKNKY